MVKRKVFDIVPPKENVEVLSETPLEEKLAAVELEEKKPAAKKKSAKKEKKPFPKVPVLIGASLILIVVFCLLFIDSKAEVEITPVREDVSYNIEALVAVSGGDIPGEMLKAEKTVLQEFPATGQTDSAVKARGKIRIYNNYSTVDQPLLINTRFISDNGKLFRTLSRIVVPGQQYSGGKLVPGEIDVEVIAAEAGESYNIGPATFSIPGFSGTAKYTAFYGKSFEAMAGGSSKTVSQVVKSDLVNAEKTVQAQALEQAAVDLTALASEGYVFFEGMIKQATPGVEISAGEGDAVSNFTAEAKASAQALVFKKADLESFALSFIKSKIAADREVQESSLSVDYAVKTADKDGTKITLSLAIAAKIYQSFDENSLKEVIKERKAGEIKAALGDYPNIESLNIRLWPFWVDRAPQDPKAIVIKLKLD